MFFVYIRCFRFFSFLYSWLLHVKKCTCIFKGYERHNNLRTIDIEIRSLLCFYISDVRGENQCISILKDNILKNSNKNYWQFKISREYLLYLWSSFFHWMKQSIFIINKCGWKKENFMLTQNNLWTLWKQASVTFM